MRDPNLIGADLKAWLAASRLTEAAFAARVSAENRGLNVSQSWLSRIAAGKFRRLTPKIKAVIAYADIPVAEESGLDDDGVALIEEAVSKVWNGSLSHARLIAKLIKVAHDIAPPTELFSKVTHGDSASGRRNTRSKRRARRKT